MIYCNFINYYFSAEGKVFLLSLGLLKPNDIYLLENVDANLLHLFLILFGFGKVLLLLFTYVLLPTSVVIKYLSYTLNDVETAAKWMEFDMAGKV